jgi:SAM-dependent methyltransferase
VAIRGTAEQVANVCAGPFGALYASYIERPGLTQLLGRVLWGVDSSVLYSSMEPIARVEAGATIVDVPCGGGIAFRVLDPAQDVRYIAADLDPKMLRRAERRARKRSLRQVEFVVADMTALPFADREADLFLSYSGLHMLDRPERAVAEIARCLKPGGRLIGATFLAGESPRTDRVFERGARRGHPLPPRREDLLAWLSSAGLVEPTIGPQPGFAAFEARKGSLPTYGSARSPRKSPARRRQSGSR